MAGYVFHKKPVMVAVSIKMELKRHHLLPKGAKTMTSRPIITWLNRFKQFDRAFFRATPASTMAAWTKVTAQLPPFVRQSLVVHRYLKLLGPLPWAVTPRT
jgi:hypothetical protein